MKQFLEFALRVPSSRVVLLAPILIDPCACIVCHSGCSSDFPWSGKTCVRSQMMFTDFGTRSTSHLIVSVLSRKSLSTCDEGPNEMTRVLRFGSSEKIWLMGSGTEGTCP